MKKTRIKTALKNPKVQKALLVAAGYAAGAYTGPAGAAVVAEHGPAILSVLISLL